MPKAGPKRTQQYSEEFKATAVQLSELPGVQTKDGSKGRRHLISHE